MIKLTMYANRKLYNSDSHKYISQKDLIDIVKTNDIQVLKIIKNNKSKDITSLILKNLMKYKELDKKTLYGILRTP